MFPLAFVAGSLQGHLLRFISRNSVVWPVVFPMNLFIALKGTHFLLLFAFTAAAVVQCGGRKTSSRTSAIVQLIFYFWPFEISVNILRNQKYMIGLVQYSRQIFNYLDPILIFFSLWIDCLFEILQNCSMFPLAFVCGSLQGHWWGFISRNFVVWPIFFLMNVFTALKGTHFLLLFHVHSCIVPIRYDWNIVERDVESLTHCHQYEKSQPVFSLSGETLNRGPVSVT